MLHRLFIFVSYLAVHVVIIGMTACVKEANESKISTNCIQEYGFGRATRYVQITNVTHIEVEKIHTKFANVYLMKEN